MKQRTLELTTLGLFGAIITIMSFVPQLGFITLGVIELTIIHIPVLIGGYFGGKKVTIGLALIFGFSSFIQSLLRGTGFSIFFQNPLMSVVPRLLFGIALVLLISATNKFIKNKLLGLIISFSVSTLFHTIFVMSFIFYLGPIFYPVLFNDFFPPNFPLTQVLWIVMGTNGFFEIIAAVLVAVPIALRISAANPFQES